MQHALMQITQAAVIQNSRGQILLLRMPDGRWHFPGGRINVNETWHDALRREILEETGIAEVEIHSLIAVDNWISATSKLPTYGVFFRCTTVEDVVILCHEHDQFVWIDKHVDLGSYNFYHPMIQTIIQEYFS